MTTTYQKYILPALSLLILTCMACGCSTTKNLPEGEQLYIGLRKTEYTDAPGNKKNKKQDSTGVITAIAQSVDATMGFLKGNDAQKQRIQEDSAQTKAERAQRRKKDQQDFERVKSEVDAVLAYPPNGSIFGSSQMRWPIQPGLWIYNSMVNKKGKLAKWIFRRFASTPVLLSTVNPDVRIKVASNTLRNYGYFRGKVNYDTIPQKNPRKTRVAYTVQTGRVFRLDSIAYEGFWPDADSLIKANQAETKLHKGDAFNVVNLSDEQKRIETLLRENGYYYYSAPYATFKADTTQHPYRVSLKLMPTDNITQRQKSRWYMGRTYISLKRTDTDIPNRRFSSRDSSYTFFWSGEKMPLKPRMWFHAITQRRGDLYSLSDQNMTQEKIGAIGVLSQMDINYIPRDTTATCDTLDLYINATMDKLYDSNFEVSAEFKSNQQVGPVVSYGLAKRNAFGAGEKVSFDIYGSYEWQTGAGAKKSGNSSLLNSYELGTKLALEFPRFLIPRAGRRRWRFPATSNFALESNWKNRANFYGMLSFGFTASYQWHPKSTTKHELIPFGLDFDRLQHTTHEFDSIMTANPALYTSMRDQFVPSIYYAYTYASPAQRKHPIWLQVTLKEAGNLLSGFYAAAGKPFNQQDKQLFGNPFAQFVKATFEVHKTFSLTPGVKIATRFYSGVILSYGNSLRAPYTEQFYVGGANSIRGFAVRSVGPGRYQSPLSSAYAYTDQTGDFKLEANAELRFHLFGDLHGATFLDAGNVWLTRRDAQRPNAEISLKNLKDIAVGTGVGLRYDLDFLVIRFDVGVALHAPYDTGKSGWYNMPRFKDSLAYHLAIGYPF